MKPPKSGGKLGAVNSRSVVQTGASRRTLSPPAPSKKSLSPAKRKPKKRQKTQISKTERMAKLAARPPRLSLKKNSIAVQMGLTSHTYYNNLWATAQIEIRQIIREEKKRGSVSISDRRKMATFLGELMFKYQNTFKKLDEVYDQMVHPQKRLLVRKLLDLIISRLIEIRTVMVDCENSEFHYFDEIAYLERLSPEGMDILVPKYYFHDPPEIVGEREKWLRKFTHKDKQEEENAALHPKDKENSETESWINAMVGEEFLPTEQAVLAIQTFERHRQGKHRFSMAKYIYEEEQRILIRKQRAKMKFMNPVKATIIIQVSVV